jgi:hypothetical protein
MPSADQHRKKAENNRKFLATVSLEEYPDWVVVAAFYTAVHQVERLRSISGDGDSTGHEDRLAYIQEVHAAIHSAYHILQNASMLARYQSNATFFGQFQRETIAALLVGRHLVEIENYVDAYKKSVA